MALEIRLLGTPMILLDGTPQPPPRGAKAWALLAYLLLEPDGRNRVRLASMLFGDADDPLASLRWNLNALRRSVGDPETFRGDPIDPMLPAGTRFDVAVLRSGSWPDALELAGLGLELLDGLSVNGSPGFDAWLAAERRRVAGDSCAALRGSALDPSGASLTSASVLARSHLTSLVPWVESFLGDVALQRGEISEARRLLEHAFALACQLPGKGRCQTLSARGLGSLNAVEGDIPTAVHWFDVARTSGPQVPDYFAWFKAYALEALCDLAVSRHLPGAATWITALEEAAGRRGMRDLLARALHHRGRLGDDRAKEAGRALAADIDSPALHRLVDA